MWIHEENVDTDSGKASISSSPRTATAALFYPPVPSCPHYTWARSPIPGKQVLPSLHSCKFLISQYNTNREHSEEALGTGFCPPLHESLETWASPFISCCCRASWDPAWFRFTHWKISRVYLALIQQSCSGLCWWCLQIWGMTAQEYGC